MGRVFTIIFFLLFVLIPGRVLATGGAYPYTKHGGGTVDGVNFNGVDRGVNPDYSSVGNQYFNTTEAGVYQPGECGQCHETHASFGGLEPPPATGGDAGPDPYLLFKEYGTSANYSELCWYCHEYLAPNGKPTGYGYWGFYQGKTVYQASSHYNSPNMFWPGTTGDPVTIWPRQSRQSLPSGNKGSCLNCHTPHGIKETSGKEFDTNAVPISPTNLHLAANNASVDTDYVIPRQLIAWEEALCENCHDSSGPASSDIQTEIDKRTLPGGSGHPVDDTDLAGRHTAAEGTKVTNKHVECYDCHNPHAAKAPTGAKGDGDGGRVQGMRYVDIDGVVRDPAAGDRQPYVYEVCLRCHGDSWDQVFAGENKLYPSETTSRPPGTSNKRLEFDPNASDPTYGPPQNFNSAYHPVAAAGRNTTLAMQNQLLGGLTTNSTINCTDCHNTDATGGVQGTVTESNLRTTDTNSSYTGTSPVGPHGSQVLTPSLNFRSGVTENGDRSILRDYYFTGNLPTNTRPFEAPTSRDEFQNRFKLCFDCHDYQTFYGDNDNTNFYRSMGGGPKNLHAYHLNGTGGGMMWARTYEACMICHYNVHSNVQATNTDYVGNGSLPPDGDTHLVNFAPGVVTGRNFSKPAWYYYNGSMRCDMVCHGIDMVYSYDCSHTLANGTTDTCND